MSVPQMSASAPATIGNVGPGFDVLGLALSGPSDIVTARRADHGDIRIVSIEGDGGALPTDVTQNTAGIAALQTRRHAGAEDIGIDLVIRKGIPLESGLGSSAASAAAAAHAVNLLLGSPLRKVDLIAPCIEAEAAVSGRHADNIAPALLGGLVLVRSTGDRPLVQCLPVPDALRVVVVSPDIRVPTKQARAVLPVTIALKDRTRNAANIAVLISAFYSGDLGLLADCIEDSVVTDARLPLIPGGADVLEAAKRAGALGASISGAGPAMFAFCHSDDSARNIRDAMIAAFRDSGISATGIVSPSDCPGVRNVRGVVEAVGAS